MREELAFAIYALLGGGGEYRRYDSRAASSSGGGGVALLVFARVGDVSSGAFEMLGNLSSSSKASPGARYGRVGDFIRQVALSCRLNPLVLYTIPLSAL